VHKVYDKARTPYQRLLQAGVLTEAKRQELAAVYQGLNLLLLLKHINEKLETLKPGDWSHHKAEVLETVSVATYMGGSPAIGWPWRAVKVLEELGKW